ncbi:hypothetical protein H7142_03980 [Candidatus Saccharibacteria bacterium]|nr:hypothetical protein [Candidatus Saccharibacteria bacterium]
MIFHKHKIHQHIKSKKKMTAIDKLMYFASFAYPFTALPQIIQVYTSKDVTSLSLISFALYVIFGSIFLAYAINKRLQPLVIEGALWLIIYVAMLFGILLFS